ncbi:MAG: Gfo/Idh/MocA family oxidoreductase [Planctomycetaceae bacterium]|nr:Gfo/Idh/MocA family oxidoreductase [Planctomycetaceae bacterium]
MRSEALHIAIIGCGRMGRHHAELIARDGRSRVVAVFDPLAETAQCLVADTAPTAEIAALWEAVLQRDGIDGVILCTPTAEHFMQCQAALERGWHVLCEKPLARTAEEIQSLIALGRQHRERGRAFSVGYQRRHWGTCRTLRKLVQSGRYGAVRAVSLHAVENWQSTIAGTWRDDPVQNPGGFIGDAGSHKLDILGYITGLPPREVFARSDCRGSRVEIVASVSAVFGDDVPVTMDFIGDGHRLAEDLHIHLADADLVLRDNALYVVERNELRPLSADEPHGEPVTGWLDAILNGAENLAPPECAWPVWQLTAAIRESARTGMSVRITD